MAKIFAIYCRVILFGVLLLLNSTSIHARTLVDNWEVVKEDKENNITIYYRTLETGYTEFKGITYINSSLNSSSSPR